MHVLKIHNVQLDYKALALAMGNGKFIMLSYHFLFITIMTPTASIKFYFLI